jgi:hypothetical protein
VEERVPAYPHGEDEGDESKPKPSRNEVSGNVDGPVVQAGRIGEVHFHTGAGTRAGAAGIPAAAQGLR